jgi:plastocyanin
MALAASLVTPLAAQTPAGLKMRVDRSTDAQDPDDNPELKVVTAGKGYRVTGGPAGVFWNPANTATGNFTARATFTLMQPSNHTNYYGLVIGGSALEGASQSYTYFVVAQNGTFLVKARNGEATPTLQNRTPHAAIKQPDDKKMSTNVLEVRVAGDTITFAVNDQVVHKMPKGTIKTDGLVGVRVNHMLDIQVDGTEIRKG